MLKQSSSTLSTGDIYESLSLQDSRDPQDPRKFRLITLLPGSDPEALQCLLNVASLNTNPNYEALSYVWGDPKEKVPIICNGAELEITRDLHIALRRLRHVDRSRTLWVDAISIDQKNRNERSVQVGLMGDIYASATIVLVWLGPECGQSPLALRLIRDLNNCSADKCTNLIQESERKTQFDALLRLFRRYYWMRVWVIQEVTCAKKVSVFCGKESISWRDLNAIYDILEKVKDSLAKYVYHDDPGSIYTLLSAGPKRLLLGKVSSDNYPSLLELLWKHHYKFSTDPLDKVYALVGISSSRETFGLLDYGRSIQDTYVHTAKHIISTSKTLDVICVKEHDGNIDGLPTWVPDWTRFEAKYPVIGLHHRRPPYAAAGGAVADASFSESGYGLRITGFIIDAVKDRGIPFHLENDPPSNILLALGACQQWWTIFLKAYDDNPASQKRFLRVACGGDWAPIYDIHSPARVTLLFDLINAPMPEQIESEEPAPKSELLGNEQRQVIFSASRLMHGKRLVLSSSKIACLAPWDTEDGDLICILLGCSFPVILRPRDDHYLLVGEAYVDGIMYGEAFNRHQMEKEALETFLIQ
ncbi:related to heterokaryon incompatibility protein het-6 [Phialocephala subalpina]|uniref:Related to heterokaryon incompatibility protein het-6 n=1 Tax=Phialocephala subalpina TaxID=576137 RepID=A0A1L7XCJ2_9HELO|nr:related to heterokaryon incompatibility protein het-6 [Phialocephala subalpina]